jgi:glutamate-1-semialdehyde 2,1-aminomutase
MTIVGFTSTGSKRPQSLFGPDQAGLPLRMSRSNGCTAWDTDGREYLDFVMALGAVGLGYGHPGVNEAAMAAIERGGIGPLSPDDEALLAEDLSVVMPWLESVLFLKSGAEAVAAAVRIARTATGRAQVIGCGYHGWLDWCSVTSGVPHATRGLFRTIPFNDPVVTRREIRSLGTELACVVVEPVIEDAPTHEWLGVLREETRRIGALLVFDEIKTAFRVAVGGASEKWGIKPDLMVLGKAMASGYPLAAVGGSRDVMDFANRTWISSTMSTEFVSLAAARATIAAYRSRPVIQRLDELGDRLLKGLHRLADRYHTLGVRPRGVAQMCYLQHASEQRSHRVAAECARRGLLFKRTAYNFVSFAHDEAAVDRALAILDDVLSAC